MTVTQIRDTLQADGLTDLAVADPANDLCYEYTLARMDGALERVSTRLDGHVGPDALAQLTQAGELLAAVPPAARRAVHAQPYYMYWLVRQYQRCVAGDRPGVETAMLDVGRFVALTALKHRVWIDGTFTVRARQGQVRFPGHRNHVLLPVGTPDGPVDLTVDGDVLRLHAPGCDIYLPVDELLDETAPRGGSPVARRPVIPGTSIEVDGTDPFVGELFASMNSRPPMPNYPPRDLAGVPWVPEETLEHFAAACRLISSAWPAAGAELLHYTRLVVPFVSRCYSTFAEAAFLGAVFMGECRHRFTDHMFTAEHLLHEHSHLRLHLIMEQDRLFEADQDALVVSPWRRDPRPVIGIVQAVFVFARVARFLRYAYHLLGEERYAERREAVTADVRAGLKVLHDADHVTLTPLGLALFEQCAAEAETPSTTGPEEVGLR